MSTPAVESPIAKSSAIVQSDQNVKSIEDKFGAQITRSGQTVDESFTSACIASYSNLAQAPVVCALFFALLAITLAEYLETTDGPLENVYNALLEIIKANKSRVLVTLARVVALLFKFLIAQKDWVLNVMLISVPYFRKPSSKNLKLTVIFGLAAVLFDSSPFIVLLFSQAWFLITELRNPKFKMVVAMIMALVFMLTWVEVASNVNPTNTTATTPAKPAVQNDSPSQISMPDVYANSPFLTYYYTLEQFNRLSPSQQVNIPRIFPLEKFKSVPLEVQIRALYAQEIDSKHTAAYVRHTYKQAFKHEMPPEMKIDDALLKFKDVW